MREILMQINFFEASIEEQKEDISILQNRYNREKELSSGLECEQYAINALSKFISEEKHELIKYKMNYLGMVRAWLDTLPEDILQKKFARLEECIKEKFFKYYANKDDYVLCAYSYGYHRVLEQLVQKYEVSDKLYFHNRIMGRMKMNFVRDEIVHDNIFKRLRKNEETFYDFLSKRDGIQEEMDKVRLARIYNSNF